MVLSRKAGVRDSNEDVGSREPIWKRLWIKSGLTFPLCVLMVKGSLGPVIALALFQWSEFADYYTTIGYLVAIVTILSFPIMPRAKFMQNMLFNVVGVCFGAAINILVCFCAVKAREHTTRPQPVTSTGPTTGATTVAYNSSASAVAGVWLFFNVLFANALRFKFPQFQTMVILYSINANISAIYAPQFPTMAAAEAFVKKLLVAFLGGFGIATVVNVFIFPVTSRQVVQGHLAAYLANLKEVMVAERDYLQSMESGELQSEDAKEGLEGAGEGEGSDTPAITAATKKLKVSILGITALHGKLAQDLIFAKRELAWGKLTAKDLDKIFKLLRQILLPSLGISSVADIFERVASGKGWGDANDPKDDGPKPPEWIAAAEKEKREWNEVMKTLHDPFQELVEAMSEGLTHIGYQLAITKRPKRHRSAISEPSNARKDVGVDDDDVEASAGSHPLPGDDGFGGYLDARIKAFSRTNKASLLQWCRMKGLTDEILTPEIGIPPGVPKPRPSPEAERERRHLYIILYMEFLLWSTAKAVLDLVKFADEKVASGQMQRNKLQMPGKRRLRKWLLSCFVPEDSTAEHTPDTAESGFSNTSIPSALRKRKDPEHLPPANAFERFGEDLRKVGQALESQEIAFGFRVACATMSVAIMAFLRQTQTFFVHERLFWAQIMVAISMSITSGSGIFAFGLRILGTLTAACVALVLWYIAGGRGIPGALLPLLFLTYLPEMWCFLKFPRYLPAFMVTMITQVLILGYELEVDKLGQAALASNGQAYHPIYVFAWIRLATVTGGLAVAFIWTYFPYPLTAKNAMRRRLADVVYLLASYYSCVHATIGLRIEGCGGDPDEKGTPAHQLRKTRFKLAPKILGLLTEIRGHLTFTKYEFEIGGRFPKQSYVDLVNEVNNIFNYMSLIDYATATYATARTPQGHYRLGKDSREVGVPHDAMSDSEASTLDKEDEAGFQEDEAGESAPGTSSINQQQDLQGHNASSSLGASGTHHLLGEELHLQPTSASSCHGPSMDSTQWLRDLARVRRSLNLTTEDITSLLSLLSYSLSNAQPLPPFLRPPTPYLLSNRIRDIDPDILSIKHVTQPGYAAFAVTQVASRLISADIEKVLQNVRNLVGEVDFSYRAEDEPALKLGQRAQKRGKLD